MNYRPQRLSKLMREQLSAILMREVEFDGALVTITDIVLDDKLEHANILISVWPKEKTKDALKIFRTELPHLRFLLGPKVPTKRMPILTVTSDEGMDNAESVEKLFLKLGEEGQLPPEDVAPPDSAG